MQINSKYFSTLNKNKGFFVINLNNSELNIIRNFIEQQWIKKINDFDPKLSNIFKKNTIINYHKNSDKLKHAQLWPKVSRILPAENVEKITTLPFFNSLKLNQESEVLSFSLFFVVFLVIASSFLCSFLRSFISDIRFNNNKLI